MPDDVKDIPALRDRKKARQRVALLQAAAELFRERGYDRTRMEDIAILADVSTPTVYNYFATKQGVLVELLTQDRLDMQEPVEAVLQSARRPCRGSRPTHLYQYGAAAPHGG
jgi:AcrR family transcriptional regulator